MSELLLPTLSAEHALNSLLNRYCAAADAQDWATWGQCWTTDAVFDYPEFGRFEGRDDIQSACAAAESRYLEMQHSIVNRQYWLDGEQATGRAQLIFAGVLPPAGARRLYECGGRYEWAFVRSGPTWLIQSMRLQTIWERLPDRPPNDGRDLMA